MNDAMPELPSEVLVENETSLVMTEQGGGGPVLSKPVPPASPGAGGQAERRAQRGLASDCRDQKMRQELQPGHLLRVPPASPRQAAALLPGCSALPAPPGQLLCHRQTQPSWPLAPRADESGGMDPEVPDVALTRAEANTQCSVHSPEGKGGSHRLAPTPGQTRSPQAVCLVGLSHGCGAAQRYGSC